MSTYVTPSAARSAYDRPSMNRSANFASHVRPEVKPTSSERPRTARHKSKKSIPAGFWMALFSWILAIGIMSGSFNEAFSMAESSPKQLEIQVEKGDTLWAIAQELNTQVFHHEFDVRYLIYVIEEANGLESATIHPGQILIIPLEL